MAQYTKEGDTIFDFLYYNGQDIYHVNDSSRDEFFGTGDRYYEETFPYIKAFDNVARNGDKSKQIVLIKDNNMTFDEFNALINSDKYSEKNSEVRILSYIDDAFELSGTDNKEQDPKDGSDLDVTEVLIPENKITSIVVTNGYTGNKKSFAVTDGMKTYQEIIELYSNLSTEPSDVEDRFGYGYRMELFDYKGDLLQTVTPYKDVINIDGKMYSSLSPDLLIKLSMLF